MALRTASVTGDWDDDATWGGVPGTVPVAADTVLINGNIVVTIPVGVEAACSRCTVGATDNTGGNFATLIVNGKITITSGETLRIGGTVANRDAKLVLGPGGWIVATSGMYFNSCQVSSTATKESPAKITGTAISTLATGPKQDIQLSHVSFQNTGVITLNLENTLGTFTSQLVLTNCVFAGNAAIAFGTTSTPNTTPIDVTYCDFRDITGGKSVTIRRITGGAATYRFSYNTVYQTTPDLQLRAYTSTGLVIRGNAFYNVSLLNDAGGGALDVQDNLWSSSVDTPNIWGTVDSAVGNTFSYNYLLSVNNNMRGLIPSSSGGSGTNEVSYNILEGPSDGTHDKPDLIVARGDTIPINAHHNIIIGAGEIAVGARVGAWSVEMTFKNNTITGAGPNAPGGTSGIGHIYDPEGVANSGAMTLANNLVNGVDKLGDITISGTESGDAQTISYSDYNRFYQLATPYQTSAQLVVSAGNTGKTLSGSHDGSAAPVFFDPRRNFAFWNSIFGDGTNTNSAAISYLTGMNGYRGTPNFDQNGTAAPWTPRQMIDWVRAGYAPTNLLLRAAGDPSDSSPDVGAVPVQSKTTPFFF